MGKNTLERKLEFIANSLDVKGDSSRSKLHKYFITEFFKDHTVTYTVNDVGKRPIY